MMLWKPKHRSFVLLTSAVSDATALSHSGPATAEISSDHLGVDFQLLSVEEQRSHRYALHHWHLHYLTDIFKKYFWLLLLRGSS